MESEEVEEEEGEEEEVEAEGEEEEGWCSAIIDASRAGPRIGEFPVPKVATAKLSSLRVRPPVLEKLDGGCE